MTILHEELSRFELFSFSKIHKQIGESEILC